MSDTRRPNVIVIIMDDLCWGDLACHGNPHTRTPNLDRMHGESARCVRYCSGPLCSPARASLMTGRYHMRTRVIDTYCGRSQIDPDEPTLARALSAAGYRTGAFGKWHLGDCHPMRAMDMGFEETLMHRGGGIGQPGDAWENYLRGNVDSYFDPVLYRDGVEEQSSGYCTDIFGDAAVDFIRRHKEEPFFAYLATNAPHSPLLIGDEWADTYREMGINDTHARLYGMVENIDHNVGKVLDTLEELDLADDTIVVYTSDHGPCGSARDRNAPPGRQDRWNAGLRGIKGSLYEGGIRVPSFWRFPEKYAAGLDVDHVTHPVDVMPTLLAACGAPLPEGHVIDGLDLTPLLTGEAADDDRWSRPIYMQWHRGDIPVRYRNYAVITDRYKLHRPDENTEDQLYDLQADPGETTDIAADHPDTVAEMRALYDAWFDEVGATRGPGAYDPPVIPVGADEENPTLLTEQDWRLREGEGWNRDDFMGCWTVRPVRPGPYTVTLRFRRPLRPGTLRLRCNDPVAEMRAPEGEQTATLENVCLPEGYAELEAWCELDEPGDNAYRRRFVPAVHVELLREE